LNVSARNRPSDVLRLLREPSVIVVGPARDGQAGAAAC